MLSRANCSQLDDLKEEKFRSATEIYLYKPHVVNKRVTTVRLASSLSRTDREFSNGRNLIDRRCLISKKTQIYHDQDELILRENRSIEFRPISSASNVKSCSVQCPMYRFEYFPLEHRIELTVEAEENDKEFLWLKEILLEKLVKWSQSSLTNSSEVTTLKLISIEDYQREYERLKTKYGKYLTENWCEGTDPQKHVFEDLAIASYLLIYWRENVDRFPRPIKFVDLGCGNGLLTFLLCSEGFQGVGVDVRRRRSWAMFDESFYREFLIDPRSPSLDKFLLDGQFNYLIGNHSDQLTPWLAVLACRCQCDVFLLPCCFYEFSGKKFHLFNRDETTQYEQYLAFIENLARILRFDIRRDKLRIPSTKNLCFHFHRTETTLDKNSIRQILLDELAVDIDVEHAEPQTTSVVKKADFYSTKFSIIETLFRHLLIERKSLSLVEAFELLPAELVEELKNERGGLKSIILSYRHALKFDTIRKAIDLANPLENSIKAKSKSTRVKTKPCFFHQFHPDGCPLIDEQCAFFHQKK